MDDLPWWIYLIGAVIVLFTVVAIVLFIYLRKTQASPSTVAERIYDRISPSLFGKQPRDEPVYDKVSPLLPKEVEGYGAIPTD